MHAPRRVRYTLGTRIERAMLVGAHCNQARHVRDKVLGYLGNRRECTARSRCGNGEVLTVFQLLNLLHSVTVSQDKLDMLRH